MEQVPDAGGARPSTAVLEVCAPVAADDAEQLGDRLRDVVADGHRTVLCQVRGTVDLGVLDVLARLQLLARRLGVSVHVVTAAGDDPDALTELLAVTGLDVLRQTGQPPQLQPRGQAEPREQRRVEEVVHVDELPA